MRGVSTIRTRWPGSIPRPSTRSSTPPRCCDDWERFSDPRQTTYTTYVQRARELELTLEKLTEQAAAEGDPDKLATTWRAQLAPSLGPLRYPLHGLHMLACYLGQMAPSGRITVVALFQASDELRFEIDSLVAAQVATWRAARPVVDPIPVLAIPGYSDNDCGEFYDDARNVRFEPISRRPSARP